MTIVKYLRVNDLLDKPSDYLSTVGTISEYTDVYHNIGYQNRNVISSIISKIKK